MKYTTENNNLFNGYVYISRCVRGGGFANLNAVSRQNRKAYENTAS